MIEYGLRIAASRPGEVQEEGVDRLRDIFSRRTYQDPPVFTDIKNSPLIQATPDDFKEETLKQLETAYMEIQEAGPIRRGIIMASALQIARNEERALDEDERIETFVDILSITTCLDLFEASGFIDKDPDLAA